MKFKKDGKVYESPRAIAWEYCENQRERGICPTYGKKCPMSGGKPSVCDVLSCKPEDTWLAPENLDFAKKEMGFEVIEDDIPDIREVVEKCGEGVKPDPVNRPAHYTSGGIECIDAMQAAFGDEAVKDFCLCNAFKYLWRHRNKNGVEDLKKARWYLNRLIREMEVEDDDA